MASRTHPLVVKLGSFAFRRAQRFFCKRSAVKTEEIGARLGALGYKLDRKHRERALWNLGLAFPELSIEKRRELALEVFRHFGRITADFLRSPARTNQEVLDAMGEVDISAYLRAAECERGVIVVTAHFGNWERFAHWLGATGRKISVVAREANDTALQQAVLSIREEAGVEVLARGNSARALLTKLRNNEMVGLLPDQNSEEAYLPFFGKPCGTVLGPAVLHLRTGAPLLPCFCVRVGPAKYQAAIYEPMVYKRDQTTPEQVMTDINARLEREIRKHPEQWLWLHDRWKSARRKGLL